MDQTPQRLPVLFVSDGVLLPGMVVPIELDEAAQAAVDAARSEGGDQLLVAPRLEDRYASYGVTATIEKVGRFRGGSPAAVLRAGGRARIGSGVTGPGAALWVEATPVDDEDVTPRAEELAAEYKKLVVAVLQRREAWQIVDSFAALTDPAVIADSAGYAPYLSTDHKRELLETPSVERRLELLVEWTQEYLAELDVTEKISEDVRESMEKNQREFLLRQQLAAIRKELGEGEPEGSDDYRARIEAADLPDHVREAALREVDKLERSSDQNPEAGWIRTWLDTVLDLPWQVTTDDNTDITAARAVLDADHHGLTEVKDRIVEYLAVRAAAPSAACPWSAAGDPAPSCSSPALPASARPRWASPSRVRWAAGSCGSRSAASVTRRRSAATGARTSAPCPAASSARSRRAAP